MASQPSRQQAFVKVIPRRLADELARFRKEDPDNHLVIGMLYAQAGMLEESADELKKVAPDDASFGAVRALERQRAPATRQAPPPAPAPGR